MSEKKERKKEIGDNLFKNLDKFMNEALKMDFNLYCTDGNSPDTLRSVSATFVLKEKMSGEQIALKIEELTRIFVRFEPKGDYFEASVMFHGRVNSKIIGYIFNSEELFFFSDFDDADALLKAVEVFADKKTDILKKIMDHVEQVLGETKPDSKYIGSLVDALTKKPTSRN